MPTLVMPASESLGPDHRPSEIHDKEGRDAPRNDVIEHAFVYSRSQAPTIAQRAMNPRAAAQTYNRSSIDVPSLWRLRTNALTVDAAALGSH